MKYALAPEKAASNFSAYLPDLPGCVATDATVEEAEREIRAAIHFHLEGKRREGFEIPIPSSSAEFAEAAT